MASPIIIICQYQEVDYLEQSTFMQSRREVDVPKIFICGYLQSSQFNTHVFPLLFSKLYIGRRVGGG